MYIALVQLIVTNDGSRVNIDERIKENQDYTRNEYYELQQLLLVYHYVQIYCFFGTLLRVGISRKVVRFCGKYILYQNTLMMVLIIKEEKCKVGAKGNIVDGGIFWYVQMLSLGP